MKKTIPVFPAVLIIGALLGVVLMVANKLLTTSSAQKHRPQEPGKPYPYDSEEVTFRNERANVTLSGTLTLPAKEGSYPAVVLITGSGPQNRDEEVAGHKPFLIIADYLTKHGIAVLRYDDRGFGQSTGDFKSATSLDFSTDVESAVAYLKTRKEIIGDKIGLVGHSEGGTIAPMVAARLQEIAFVVLLAGPGIQTDTLMLRQQELIARSLGIAENEIQKAKRINGRIYAMISASEDLKTLKGDLTDYIQEKSDSIMIITPKGMTREQVISAQINEYSSPWWSFMMKHNPAATLEKVTCPVLALNGARDLQVTPKENLAAIGKALKKAGNERVTLKELPKLNHFFQECETGSPKEYAIIEQTISPTALKEIKDWIVQQVN